MSHIEVKNGRRFQAIQDAMVAFQKSLADGHHIERSVVVDICKVLKIDVSPLSGNELEKVGVEVEFYIDTYCAQAKVDLPNSLTDVAQRSLVREVADHLCKSTTTPIIVDSQLFALLDECVKEMSRIQAYIYRDWQSALGDLMIKEVKDEERKYEVIGYKDFEEQYESTVPTVKKWISRADKVFNGLDVQKPNKFDDRRIQLQGIYKSTYALLKVLAKNKTSNVNIAKNAIKDLAKALN